MAIPILTVAQLIGNLSRVFLRFKQIKWKPVCMFILGAIPMSVLGAFSFVELPKNSLQEESFCYNCFGCIKYFKMREFESNDITMHF